MSSHQFTALQSPTGIQDADPSENNASRQVVPICKSPNASPRASLLGLPPELRLNIYEKLIDQNHVRYHGKGCPDGFSLSKRGSVQTEYQWSGLFGEPPAFCLLKTCRTIHAELKPMLPSIGQVQIVFVDYNTADMEQWIEKNGQQVPQMREWMFAGIGKCGFKESTDGHVQDASWQCALPKYGKDCDCPMKDSLDHDYWLAGWGLCARHLYIDLPRLVHELEEARDPDGALDFWLDTCKDDSRSWEACKSVIGDRMGDFNDYFTRLDDNTLELEGASLLKMWKGMGFIEDDHIRKAWLASVGERCQKHA